MKLINKKNFFPTVCVAYTIISISNIIFEVVNKIAPWSQFNNLQIFFISLFAIFLLSQQYRLEVLPLPLAIIIQYTCFISTIMFYMWVISHYTKVHPNGYRDMFVSSTVCYMIGVVIYEISAFIEVKKQNQDLKYIKEKLKSTQTK